jgi:hypothetical protein
MLLLLAGWPALAQAVEPRSIVQAYLEELGATGYSMETIRAPYLTATFPGIEFVGVWFQQWPVAVAPPADLAPSNVFVLQGDQISYLTSPDDLEDFFETQLMPRQRPREIKEAARAWLRLSAEFSLDGFYQFSRPEAQPSEGLASGEILVLQGGTGHIRVSLTFDAAGQLTGVYEKRKVHRGVRPICQATKLLDRDPLVRRMAEQDLLVMGRAAKTYLDQQRAKATPALKQAIDQLWKRILEEGR